MSTSETISCFAAAICSGDSMSQTDHTIVFSDNANGVCWTYRYTCNLQDVDNTFCGAFVGPDDEAQARAIARMQLDIKEVQHKDGLGGCRLRPNPKFELFGVAKSRS